MMQLLLFCAVVYLLSIRCRRDHPGWKELLGWSYAHRGLHGSGVPENSLAAFQAAVDGGYGAELDVHLLKDGNLAVIHDSLLNRTTGQAGRVEDLTTEELKQYHLEGTDQAIPELMDVLTLVAGRAPLIVELKPVDGNHAQLTEAVCRMLQTYRGVFCLESFDTRCLIWLKKHRPDIIRGQLAEDFRKTRNDLPEHMRFLMTHLMGNFAGVPDFIAYRFDHRNSSPSCRLCRNLWKAKGVSWTLRSRQDYDTAVAEGWIPIFEGFRPETENRLEP